jgi:hypothetical protein
LWRENSVHDPLDPVTLRAIFDAVA